MANRYLRASGNWNGPVWAATSNGAAGSAATPTAGDDVYIRSNFTVNLSGDAICTRLYMDSVGAGRLNLNGYRLSIGAGGQISHGVLDLSNGTLQVDPIIGFTFSFNLHYETLNLITDNSLIVVNSHNSASGFLRLGSKIYNDVILNMQGSSETMRITGSPTFRSLIIQSKNSAAHTVNFDDGAYVRVEKAVYLGSSPSNRLTIDGQSTDSMFSTQDYGTTLTGTFYAQNINLKNWDLSEYVSSPDNAQLKLYAGTGSTSSNLSGGSLTLQDPPKISTLVDPLTTAPESNPNWAVSGTVTQVTSGLGGGGYSVEGYGASIVSSDTYDITEGQTIFEMNTRDGVGFFIDNTITSSGGAIIGSMSIFLHLLGRILSPTFTDTLYTKFIRINLSGTSLSIDTSEDGMAFSSGVPITLTPEELLLFKSVRVKVVNTEHFYGSPGIIGSINMLPKPKNTGNFLAFFTP